MEAPRALWGCALGGGHDAAFNQREAGFELVVP